MKRLAGANDFFEYEKDVEYEGDVRVKVHVKNAKDIGKLLLGVLKKNQNLEDNCFNLGWSSIVLLEQMGGQFSIKELYCRNQNKIIEDTSVEKKLYCQAATHIVDSCTFVHIRIGETLHLLAHLNYCDLKVGFDQINQILSKYHENNLYIFSSCIYGKEELNFVEAIEMLCNKGMRYVRLVGNTLPDIDDDNAMNFYYATKRLGHMEIGLYIDEDQRVELFGDVTDCSSCIDKKEAPTMLFSTMNELKNILSKKIT